MNSSTTSLSSLTHDSANANRGTERGLDMIRASLEKLGAGRSIVLDKHGRIVAGNQTAKAAALAGMEDVIVIQTDGKKIVAVQRTDIDLDSAEGRELALVDNRASEVGLEWSADVLAELQAEGLDLSGLFTDDEIDGLLGELEADNILSSTDDASIEASEGEAESPSPVSPATGMPAFLAGGLQVERMGTDGVTGRPASGTAPVAVGNGIEGRPPAQTTPAANQTLSGNQALPGRSVDAPATGRAAEKAAERAARPLGPQGPPSLDPACTPTGGQPFAAAGAVEFKEFDEAVAADVKVHECPACGHRWAA